MFKFKRVILSLLIGSSIYASSVDKEIYVDFENLNQKEWTQFSTWEVQTLKDAPSGSKVVSMVKNQKSFFGFGGLGFNLFFNKNINFYNGEISVKFKANSGMLDQGGGLMWRVKDKGNYYIARFNPLEDNLTFYKVIDGDRIQLASTTITLSKGWHTIKVVQNDNHFTGYLDGKKVLEKKDDSILYSGGVGLWTKADAKTSFDDLHIKITK